MNIEGGELCNHQQQSPISIDPSKFVTIDEEIEGEPCNYPLEWNVDDTVYEWTVTHKGEAGHTLAIKSDAAKQTLDYRIGTMKSGYRAHRGTTRMQCITGQYQVESGYHF